MRHLAGYAKYFSPLPALWNRFHALANVPFLTGIALAAALTACKPEPPWHLSEVTGHLPDLEFSLISDSGKPVTAQTFKGKVVLMYFGFTNCVAECPLTMTRLAHVLKKLGKEADHLQILFVTLDPGRDAPPALHHYLASFGSAQMTGVTGPEAAIVKLVKRCRSAYRPAVGAGEAGNIAHSAAVYIFDGQARARLLFSPADSDKNLESDLLRLVHESR